MDGYKEMLKLHERDVAANCWFDWAEDEYVSLSQVVRTLLPNKLLVSTEASKLFVVARDLSAKQKYLLCRSIFQKGAAVSVTFLPHALCCAVSGGMEDAIVISLNWDCCSVVMVSDLRVLSSCEFTEYSGESIHYKRAMERSSRKPEEAFDQVEASIISELDCGELFGTNGLAGEIVKMLRLLPIDTRQLVAQNVAITGDCVLAELPRVKAKLVAELRELSGLAVSAKECLGPWGGASLYCSTTLFKEALAKWKHMEITRGKINGDTAKDLDVLFTG